MSCWRTLSGVDGMGKDCAGNIYVTTSRPVPGRADGQVVVIFDRHYVEGAGPRVCGSAPCLPAGIYSAHLNVAGFPY